MCTKRIINSFILTAGSEFMRTIRLAESNLKVADLIKLAEHDTVKLVLPDGTEFVLSAIDNLGAKLRHYVKTKSL